MKMIENAASALVKPAALMAALLAAAVAVSSCAPQPSNDGPAAAGHSGSGGAPGGGGVAGPPNGSGGVVGPPSGSGGGTATGNASGGIGASSGGGAAANGGQSGGGPGGAASGGRVGSGGSGGGSGGAVGGRGGIGGVSASGGSSGGGRGGSGGGVPANCVRVTDPTFNLDVERPRVDPTLRDPRLTSLLIVGDSTVKNHNIQQEGWGDVIDGCFDSSRIQIVNWAREGRSSRSFIEEGLWTRVLSQMKAGDFVMVQFGHNDQSTLETRGSITGVGDEVQTVVDSTTLQNVVVHTYGWYLRQYAADVSAKSANLIYVTPVPRNYWLANGTMNNTVMAQYVGWMKQVGLDAQLPVLDLNTAVVNIYTAIGQAAATAYYTSGDSTHTNLLGAVRTGAAVIDGIGSLAASNLKSFLLR